MADYEKIVIVRTGVITRCPVCDEMMARVSNTDDGDELAAQTNHLLGHGAQLLHVGQETTRTDDGDIWHYTVAVLGLSA